jgi:hypothetical protein
MLVLLVICFSSLQFAVRARAKEEMGMDKARIRYMVNDLDPAVKLYTTYLGFRVERESRPNFAMLQRATIFPSDFLTAFSGWFRRFPSNLVSALCRSRKRGGIGYLGV